MPIDVLILTRLQENDATLITLDLRDNKLGDEEAKELAKALATNTTLTSLYLSGNNLGDEGNKYLREALASNFTLLNLAGIDAPDITQYFRCDKIMARILALMKKSGLLIGNAAQANFDAAVGHQAPDSVVEALGLLIRNGLLTSDVAQANFDAVMRHQAPCGVADALRLLSKAGLLTGDAAQANHDVVARHRYPQHAAYALIELKRVGLLTGDAAHANRDAVARCQTPDTLNLALMFLSQTGLLTADTAQANFDTLVTNSAILFGSPEARDCWSRIPNDALTAERFQLIVAITERYTNDEAEGQAAFVRFVNRNILGIGAGIQGLFNEGQSTHTASVHQSVSASAKKLVQRYGTQLSGNDLDKLMVELVQWSNELPANDSKTSKTETAKRCLKRLTANDYDYAYTDVVSKVSTRQLLALFWLAIHDEENRLGSLDDAKMQLIEGLYEIQRGYNLSELGVDNEDSKDKPICSPGTFNKVMEKLHGLHPDVEVLFITKSAAALKFLLVVKEEAKKYLTELSKQPTGLSTELLEQIKGEGVPVIWQHISKNVTGRILDEFGALYNNSCENGSFKVLMATAEYVDLGDLSNFEKVSTSANKNAFFQPHDASIEEPQSEEELLRRTIQ